ncbi:MAG: translocation/assembly module TamB [Endomicrobium sp.]|jgi:hypothetical protein|nr:translocation/assembly module TamB [Endomicrobium sp.]
MPYLQKYISNKTGYTLLIGNFSVSPFKLSLENISADDFIKIKKAAFKFNLFKLFFNITSPLKSVKQLKVSNLEIDLKTNDTVFDMKSINAEYILKLLERDVDIYIDRILIKRGKELLNITNVHAYLDQDTIKLNSVLHTAAGIVKFKALLKKIENCTFEGNVFIKSDDKFNIFISSHGTINLSSFDCNFDIKTLNLGYGSFDLDKLSGFLLKNEKGLKFEVTGKFGKFELNSLNFGTADASAFIDISKINKYLSGRINVSFKKSISSVEELNIEAVKLKIFNFDIGSFKLSGIKDTDSTYKFIYDYGLMRRVETVCCKNGNYESRLIIRGKKVAYVSGNIDQGIISAEAGNITAADIPLISAILMHADERMDVSGNINKTAGKINFSFLQYDGITCAGGSFKRDKDKYILDFHRYDDSIFLKCVISNMNIMSANLVFKNINISDILPVLDISGTADGSLIYKKGTGADFDIRASGGEFYGNSFKSIELNGKTDLGKVDIKHFVVKNTLNAAIIDIKGLLGFTNKNPASFVRIDLKDVLIHGIKTSGSGKFYGYLSGKKSMKGVIRGSNIKICGLSLGNVEADVDISSEKFEVPVLKSNKGLSAVFTADLKRNKINSSISLKNTEINGFYPHLHGFLDAVIKFSGDLNNPCIEAYPLIVKKGEYLSVPFFLSAAASYRDGIFNMIKARIISGDAEIVLEKHYSNTECLKISINNLDNNIIDIWTGFKLPVKGKFFGDGEISFCDGKPKIAVSAKSNEAYIGPLKLKDVKTEIEIINKNIAIKSASAKISDSEIRLNKSFCDLNNNKYFLDLLLLNVHAGTSDLFGNIKISGCIRNSGVVPVFSGVIDLNNLWFNKYKLNHHIFNYSFKGSVLELFQEPDDENDDSFNIYGEIIFSDILAVKKLNIRNGSSYFDMSGKFSKSSIDLKLDGHDVDLGFIANILDIDKGSGGSADIYVRLKGELSELEGNMSIVSVYGNLKNIPFDRLNIYIDFYKSCAYIKEASVAKRNGVGIDIKGSFPVYFGEKANKKSIDISYKVVDNKLSMFKYLSGGFLKPLSGRLMLEGHIGGDYKNLKSNGRLLIYNGIFKSNDYLGKIKNAVVDISLVNNLVRINKFSFNSGKGKVNVTGHIGLKNFSISNFDIRAFTEGKSGIPISVPQLPILKFMGVGSVIKDRSFGEPSFDIKISGTPEKPLISGYAVLENTIFSFPGNKNGDSGFIFPAGTEFNLDLRAGNNTEFENSIVSALISGTLNISGSLGDLKSNGVIESTSGRLDCLGIEFNIVNAKMEVIDDNQIYLTGEAETTVSSNNETEPETMKLIIKRCKLSDISTSDTVTFSSKDDPNMDAQKALTKVMGIKQDNETNFSAFELLPDLATKQRILRFFNQSFSAPLTKSLLRKVKIADNFKVSYFAKDNAVPGKNSSGIVNLLYGTRYTMEKNLSRDILLGYSLAFAELNKKLDLRHSVELSYRLAPNLFLRGNYEFNDEDGSREYDRSIVLQHQFKFGSPKIRKNRK